MIKWIRRIFSTSLCADSFKAGEQALEITCSVGQVVVLAKRGACELGRLKFCEHEAGVFLLGDVEVREEHRRYGVGSKLVAAFLRHCQSKGATEAFGNVTTGDDLQPFLRKWYERMGFEVHPPDGREEFGDVKYKVIWRP